MQTEQYLIKINSYNYTDFNSNITITQQNRQRLIHYYCRFSAVYSYMPGRTAWHMRDDFHTHIKHNLQPNFIVV